MILAIETSTDVCSVALHHHGQLMGHLESREAYSHAEKLAPMIADLLAGAGITTKDLTAVAVSAGPGSYTGLRIGTSTAKGLCYAQDIPLIAINTLASMLESVAFEDENHLLCPMIDARRMEVYCLLASRDKVIAPTHALVVDESAFSQYLPGHKITFFGNGAMKCRNTITHAHAEFIGGIVPSAIHIGQRAAIKYQRGDFADLVYFEPEYLKPFVAIKAKNPLS